MQPLRKKARYSPKPISRKAEVAGECLSTFLLSDLVDIVLGYFGSGLEGRHVETFALAAAEENITDLVAMDNMLFARMDDQKIVQINPWTKSIVCVLLEAWRGGHTTFSRMTAADGLLFVTTLYHSKIIVFSPAEKSVVYKESLLPLIATVEQLKASNGKLFVLFKKDMKLHHLRVYSTTTFEILCQKEWPFPISPSVDAMAITWNRILYTRFNRKCLYFWNWAKDGSDPEQCFVGPFQETLTVNASGIAVLGTQEVVVCGLIQPEPNLSWRSILQLFPVQDPLESHFVWSSNFEAGELTQLCFDGDKLYAVVDSGNQIAVFC